MNFVFIRSCVGVSLIYLLFTSFLGIDILESIEYITILTKKN